LIDGTCLFWPVNSYSDKNVFNACGKPRKCEWLAQSGKRQAKHTTKPATESGRGQATQQQQPNPTRTERAPAGSRPHSVYSDTWNYGRALNLRGRARFV